MVGLRWQLEAECAPSSGVIKTYANLWEGELGDSHPIINEWGGAWWSPAR
jgi:hypothetical protein